MPPHPDAALVCGACVWRGDGGCRLAAADGAPPVPVDADTSACAHHADTLDCTACGACCREAYDSVPVSPEDRVLHAHPELVRRDGDWVDLHRVPSPTGRGSRCIALVGDGPYLCRIYADRPATCLHVEIGADGCLFARRRVGLSPQAPT
jgi:hypothetical protein